METIFISNSFLPSKAANIISSMKMCEKLTQNNLDVTLICKNKYEKKALNDCEIFNFYNINTKFKIKKIKISGINLLDYFLYGLKIIFIYFKNKNSFFYCKDIFTFFLLYLIKKKNLSIELHHSFENSKSRFFLKLINFKKIKVIVISNTLRSYYINNYNIPSKNILVAHDGADINQHKNNSSTFEFHQKISVGYVGSLNHGKGIKLIIDISKKLPNVTFHIIGGNKIDIIKYSENKPDNLIFHGHVYHNKLHEYFNLFEIALLPNQDEIFVRNSNTNISKWTSPIKMFEYMANKKIIIASDHEVLKEVLSDNISCFFCNPNNINEWVNKIEYVIENPKIISNIVNNAFKLLSTNYTWNKRAKNIIKFIYE